MSENREEIQEEIKVQGDLVRQLKASKADKDQVLCVDIWCAFYMCVFFLSTEMNWGYTNDANDMKNCFLPTIATKYINIDRFGCD